MKSNVIAIVVVLALLVAGAALLINRQTVDPIDKEVDLVNNSYRNEQYGIGFAYPVGYVLDAEVPEPGHHVITIIHEEDAPVPVNGEGPRAITVQVFRMPEGGQTLDEWLATPASNLALGPGTQTKVKVGETDAVSYRWSGLYEGETTAFVHEDTIIAVSVTAFSMEDQIVADYRTLLASFRLR